MVGHTFEKNLNKAIYWFELAFKQGSVTAKKYLKKCYKKLSLNYLFGKNGEKSLKKAIFYFKKSCNVKKNV